KLRSVNVQMCSHTRSENSGCAFKPVPTAVPPIANSLRCCLLSVIICSAISSIRYQPLISCPSVIGVASCKCVRPIFTISCTDMILSCNVYLHVSYDGNNLYSNLRTAAICIAVGYVSLELCELLTSSFGCNFWLLPCSASHSLPTAAKTSLTFMFDCVPLPVCQTTNGK